MKKYNTSFKNIAITTLFFLRGWKTVDNCERDRRERLENGQLYLPFLNTHCDSIFRALGRCFLDDSFLTGFRRGLLSTLWLAPAAHWSSPNLLSARPWLHVSGTDWHRDIPYLCGYLCRYNFITPKGSSSSSFWRSTNASTSTYLQGHCP